MRCLPTRISSCLDHIDRKEDLIAVPDNMFPGTTVTDTHQKSKGTRRKPNISLRSNSSM